MPLYQAIILAIVQGLTEFLPVSSTAHLAVIPRIFSWEDTRPWRNLYVIGTTMILLGILLGIADHIGTEKRGLDKMSWFDAARMRHRESAARFSFLLSTPIIAGAALSDILDIVKRAAFRPICARPIRSAFW